MTCKEFQEKVKTRKQRLLDRMQKSHQRMKREKKIEKPQSKSDNWKGLS